MAFTDLLDALGGVGRFQLVYTALLLLPCCLLACHNFLQNFTAAVPRHHCQSPVNHTVATDNGSGAWLRATRFPIHHCDGGERGPGCWGGLGWGWVLPPEVKTGASLPPLQWDLVCEARTLRDLAQSIYMTGVLVGAAVFGSLADRLGRKAPLVWSYLQLAVSGAATAYFGSFGAYCVFRFLMGMTFSGIILNSLSLVVEWMPTRGRTVAGVLLGYAFTLGQLILAGVAYLIRPWRWLQFAVSAPFLIFFLYSWWLPESSRWLLLHGKSQLALQNLRKVAAMNGRQEEGERLTEEVGGSSGRKGRSVSPGMKLDRSAASPRFSNSLAYYGLAMDLQKFGLSVYLVQVLFGMIDVPAMLVATTTMIHVGRRATVASFLILAGLMVIGNMFVPEDMQMLRTAQAALGKGCLASSFICVYLFTGELYPTEIRQMGMGFASVNARLGGLAAPLVTMLGEFSAVLPPMGFGATSILAGLAVCFLAETRNLPLLETIEAMERRVKGGLSGKDAEEKGEEISLQQLGVSPLRETI
uniref:Major facilitator superfamily (MFS) profile domain-containing protein n=1 Tax=Sus scrofa TaxID=9823 RepID=A0A8D0NN70_PIG